MPPNDLGVAQAQTNKPNVELFGPCSYNGLRVGVELELK